MGDNRSATCDTDVASTHQPDNHQEQGAPVVEGHADQAGRDSIKDPGSFEEWRAWKEWREWNDWLAWKAQRTASARHPQDPPPRPPNLQENVTAGVQAPQGISGSQVPGQSGVAPSTMHTGLSVSAQQIKTQYVLSGQPTGWAAVANIVRDYDEEKMKDVKEDIDTLLVFAGLFSAVVSAFVIFALPNLQNTQSLSTSSPPSPSSLPLAGPSTNDISVNILWLASLLISLIVASLAILVKQWLREYMAVDIPSPKARLRVRHVRYPQLQAWKVVEIAALLPLLLQLSLGLFFIGMCYFTSTVHSSLEHTTIPLVAAWATCFFGATFLPFIAPGCPYRTPFIKWLVKAWQTRLHRLLQLAARSCSSLAASAVVFWEYAHILCQFAVYVLEKNNESKAISDDSVDMDIVAEVDSIQCDDDLLASTLLEVANQVAPYRDQLRRFVLSALHHRLSIHDDKWSDSLPFMDLYSLAFVPRAFIIGLIWRYKDNVRPEEDRNPCNELTAFHIVLMRLYEGVSGKDLEAIGVQPLQRLLLTDGDRTCRELVHAAGRSKALDDKTCHIFDSLFGLRNVLEADLSHVLMHTRSIVNAYTHFIRWHEDAFTVLDFPTWQDMDWDKPLNYISLFCRRTAGNYLGDSLLKAFKTIHSDSSIWRCPSKVTVVRDALLLVFRLYDLGSPTPELVDSGFQYDLVKILQSAMNDVRKTHHLLDFVAHLPNEQLCTQYFYDRLSSIRLEYNYITPLPNLKSAVLWHLDSPDFSRLGALRICLMLICVFNPTVTATFPTWRELFSGIANFIRSRQDNLCGLKESSALTALAGECLRKLQEMESARCEWRYWCDDENSLEYRIWRANLPPEETAYGDDFIVALASFTTSYDRLWRVRRARERESENQVVTFSGRSMNPRTRT